MGRLQIGSERALAGLLRLTDYCCWLILAIMALVVSTEVVGRYAFNSSLNIAEEVASFSLVCFIFLSLPGTFREQGFLRVDLIHGALPPTVKQMLAVVFHVAALGVTAVYCFYIARLALDSFAKGTRSDMALAIPNYIPQVAMVIGAGLLMLAVLAGLLRALVVLTKGGSDDD